MSSAAVRTLEIAARRRLRSCFQGVALRIRKPDFRRCETDAAKASRHSDE